MSLPEKFDTKIVVKEMIVTSSGMSKGDNPKPYTLYQVRATNPAGVPIEHNLRSFADLPLNEVLDVHCQLFTSERYGPSYTVSRKGGSGVSKKLAESVDELRARVDKIEDWLRGRGEYAGIAADQPAAAAPPQQPAAAPAAQPPPPPPPTVAPAVPPENDIPF